MSFFIAFRASVRALFFVLSCAYDTDKYITHVWIYAGEGVMFEAGGGGVKYTDFTTAYWVNHFVGFGRVYGTSDQIVSR